MVPGPAQTHRMASAGSTAVRGLRLFVVPVLLTCAITFLRSNDVSFFGIACSFVIAVFATYAYFRWRDGQTASAVPLFAIVAAVFWVSFSLPLFWGQETIVGSHGTRYIPRSAIDVAMLAAALGMGAMWLGYNVRLRRGVTARELLIFKSNGNSHAYLWVAVLVGLVGSRFLDTAVQSGGAGLRQPIQIAFHFAPLAAFSLLMLDYFHHRTAYVERIAIPLYVAARLVIGLASGWLGSSVETGLILVLAYSMRWRRLPKLGLMLTLLVVVFLQPGKEMFRSRYWYGGESGTVGERIYEWCSESARLWTGAFFGEGGTEWRELGMKTVSRFDVLHQTANVVDYTPAVVPYQNGRLYSYLFVTLIPRFAWPNKPSMNDANRWYQVAYGLTDEENLEGVSISSGFLAEGYINFGWFGVVLIPFGIGVLLGYVESMLLAPRAGIYFNALGIALAPQLISIESQLGQYVAGIVQMIALTTLVLLPVLVWKRKAERRAFAATARTAGVPRPRVVAPAPSAGPLSPA
jgi:hypothetical protein